MTSPGPTPDPSEDDAFLHSLFGEDELGVVVRAHIHVEAKLVELLQLLVVDAAALERMDLDFGQRVHLAVALGLNPEHAPGLRALGSLRNAFAHRLDTQLSANRVDSLYQALSSGDKIAVRQAYGQTEAQMGPPPPPGFDARSPKERFIFIAVALRALLSVAIREHRSSPGEH
jgi:hypothetical protein